MDNSTHIALTDQDLTEANLLGATIFGADNAKIGTVSHIHGLGAAVKVIVDVGGFLGIGAKSVAMTTDQLDFMRADDNAVYAHTSWTKDQGKRCQNTSSDRPGWVGVCAFA